MQINQALVDGVVAAASIALMGVGFSLVYRTHRFFYFAHGGAFAAGAYVLYWISSSTHLPTFGAALIAVVVLALLGGILDIAVFRRLRSRNTSPLVKFLASLGLFVMIENLLSLLFGDSPLVINGGSSFPIIFYGARLNGTRIMIVFSAAITLICVFIFMKFTRLGRAARAVSIDSELSAVLGIEANRILTVMFSIGSALAGLAGILVGMETLLVPSMGFRALLLGVSAVVLGGENGTLFGLLAASLAIGMTQHLGALLAPSRWQDSMVFLLVVLFLFIKPNGFFGTTSRPG